MIESKFLKYGLIPFTVLMIGSYFYFKGDEPPAVSESDRKVRREQGEEYQKQVIEKMKNKGSAQSITTAPEKVDADPRPTVMPKSQLQVKEPKPTPTIPEVSQNLAPPAAPAPQVPTMAPREPAMVKADISSPQPAIPSPKEHSVPLPQYHLVQRGENLESIALRIAEDHSDSAPIAWPSLWAMNPKITNPHQLPIGMKIRIRK